MGAWPRRSKTAAGLALGAFLLHAGVRVVPAHAATHADAGAERQAAVQKALPEPPVEGQSTDGVSTLKTIRNPGQLSESVRARLEQRGLRHAANMPGLSAHEEGRGVEHSAASADMAGRSLSSDEPLRRGQAHLRRVQAVETVGGVTVLSNRLQLPEPRLALTAQRVHEAEPALLATADEGSEQAASSSVTETRSLRALSSRPSKARTPSTGLGWLIWPFVLCVATGAVVGTLWFRKKTE